MAKSPTIVVGERDVELLQAIDMLPLTPAQLLTVSRTFERPFPFETALHRRLRQLAAAGLVRSFSYAVTSRGRSPSYLRLTRNGYRWLHGPEAPLPSRRRFEEIAHGHHHHTRSLTEFIVRVLEAAHAEGITVTHFARENEVRFDVDGDGKTLFPDACFRLQPPESRPFNFVVELDNGTERVRSGKDVESIERKVRGYDRHQTGLAAHDPSRFVVLFVTTRSKARVASITECARSLMANPRRTLFLTTSLEAFLEASDPLRGDLFVDNRGRRASMLPGSTGTGATVNRAQQLSR